MKTTNWFTSTYSNNDLANILSDYSKDVTGFRVRVSANTGRCTLAAQLEALDAQVAAMSPAQLKQAGFVN